MLVRSRAGAGALRDISLNSGRHSIPIKPVLTCELVCEGVVDCKWTEEVSETSGTKWCRTLQQLGSLQAAASGDD